MHELELAFEVRWLRHVPSNVGASELLVIVDMTDDDKELPLVDTTKQPEPGNAMDGLPDFPCSETDPDESPAQSSS